MIINYHHVAPTASIPKDADPLEGWNCIHSPDGFERQLIEIKRRGYRFIQLAEYVDVILESGKEPPNAVVVTFDDGWIDNYTYAFPILKRLSIPATFFITTDHLQKSIKNQRKMDTAQLRELSRAGMSLGGHTRRHPDLTNLSIDEAEEEIAGCKEDLENIVGVGVHFFAYPGGAFNSEVARLTAKAGFRAACSTLGPLRNEMSSIYWLYRDVITEPMNTLGDHYRLSPIARRLFSFRVARRLRHILNP